MMMKSIVVLLAAISMLSSGRASAQVTQAAAPPIQLFASSTDVAALIAKAKAERKPDQANFIQPLLALSPYTMQLEYRVLVGPAAVHENDAEIFYVIEGAGTLVTGGTLRSSQRTNAENLTGTGIDGGVSRHVAKGDVLIVPEKTPHWYSSIEGTLVLMSLRRTR
jgi:mannose-6-phosphate isomerase-like protein (cupin superfamily)